VFYGAGELVVCPACREQIIAATSGGSAVRRFFRAALFGIGAGLAGALLWYGVAKLFNMQLGLIAVVVGLAVGSAVRKGSDGRGGLAYQILAVVITYCCIVLTYVPELYTLSAKEHPGAPAVALTVLAVIVAFIAPILSGNIIGILIIGFALWEAWKINKPRNIEFTGPFTVASSDAPPAPPALQPPPPLSPPSITPPPPPPAPPLGMT
jgi:hypothetical protein